MVIRENIMINERAFVRSYSDEGRYLLRDGVAYGEAIDPAEYAEERVYTEGDVMSDDDAEGLVSNTATVEDYQAALTEMGVSLDD
jgi:hypothetical protein